LPLNSAPVLPRGDTELIHISNPNSPKKRETTFDKPFLYQELSRAVARVGDYHGANRP